MHSHAAGDLEILEVDVVHAVELAALHIAGHRQDDLAPALRSERTIFRNLITTQTPIQCVVWDAICRWRILGTPAVNTASVGMDWFTFIVYDAEEHRSYLSTIRGWHVGSLHVNAPLIGKVLVRVQFHCAFFCKGRLLNGNCHLKCLRVIG